MTGGPLFFRYPVPQRICLCDHSAEAHDIEKRAQPCTLCACHSFSHYLNRFTEKRTVDEVIP